MIIDIIFEDSELLVLSKPAGVHSVPAAVEAPSLTVASYIAKHFPGCIEAGENPGDSGLVNRLDFQTSGLILAAKTRQSWTNLRSLQNSGKINKTYLAICDGALRQAVTIETYLGSRYRRSKKVSVFSKHSENSGRVQPATTSVGPLNYFEEYDFSLVSALIQTGRRHQIRAQLAHISHPLCGDLLYGSSTSLQNLLGDNAPEFFLHSWKLSFNDREFSAGLPKYADTKLSKYLSV